MANKYYNVATSDSVAIITDIVSALTDKFGVNFIIHYQNANFLIFSCSSISNKVIKLEVNSNNRIIGYFGDAWVSGTNINNQLQFFGGNTGTPLNNSIVCGDKFVLLSVYKTSVDFDDGFIIIGQLTNEDYICVGLNTSSSTNGTYLNSRRAYNTTKNVPIYFVTWDDKFTSVAGKLYKQPLIIVTDGDIVLENSDGSLATIGGIYNVSYLTSGLLWIKTDDYYITKCKLYYTDAANGVIPVLATPLLIELT